MNINRESYAWQVELEWMLLLLYLENQYSIETIGLCIHEQPWKQICKINMCMYLVFDEWYKFHENEKVCTHPNSRYTLYLKFDAYSTHNEK